MNKKVEIKDNVYVIDGKSYPRVTRILDIIAQPEFFRWYAKHGYYVCEKIKKDRAAFGTRVHKEIKNWFDKKEVWVDDEEMEASLETFASWAEEHKLVPEFTEKHFKCEAHNYAGTFDFVGKFNGKKMLLDWKTSKRIYDNFSLQIAAYVYGYEENFGDILDGAGVVLVRDGSVKFREYTKTQIRNLFDVFLSARNLYYWKHGL